MSILRLRLVKSQERKKRQRQYFLDPCRDFAIHRNGEYWPEKELVSVPLMELMGKQDSRVL